MPSQNTTEEIVEKLNRARFIANRSGRMAASASFWSGDSGDANAFTESTSGGASTINDPEGKNLQPGAAAGDRAELLGPVTTVGGNEPTPPGRMHVFEFNFFLWGFSDYPFMRFSNHDSVPSGFQNGGNKQGLHLDGSNGTWTILQDDGAGYQEDVSSNVSGTGYFRLECDYENGRVRYYIHTAGGDVYRDVNMDYTKPSRMVVTVESQGNGSPRTWFQALRFTPVSEPDSRTRP